MTKHCEACNKILEGDDLWIDPQQEFCGLCYAHYISNLRDIDGDI